MLFFRRKHIKFIAKTGHNIAILTKKTLYSLRPVMPEPLGVLLKQRNVFKGNFKGSALDKQVIIPSKALALAFAKGEIF